MNLRQQAKGRDCQIRLPGVCNGDPETTVLAHLNGGGMGMKRSDLACGAWACSACHDAVDGRTQPRGWAYYDLQVAHKDGVIRTIEILEQEGIIGCLPRN